MQCHCLSFRLFLDFKMKSIDITVQENICSIFCDFKKFLIEVYESYFFFQSLATSASVVDTPSPFVSAQATTTSRMTTRSSPRKQDTTGVLFITFILLIVASSHCR